MKSVRLEEQVKIIQRILSKQEAKGKRVQIPSYKGEKWGDLMADEGYLPGFDTDPRDFRCEVRDVK